MASGGFLIRFNDKYDTDNSSKAFGIPNPVSALDPANWTITPVDEPSAIALSAYGVPLAAVNGGLACGGSSHGLLVPL
jgi:hypothetical protein